MANKRMFSIDIVSSDAFLDMPTSSRELYFQLGMYADDEGFVNPKKILRMINASEDDLKILIAKRFVLPFESGVVVIKHWLIHNTIRMDRFSTTQYKEEKSRLFIKENKAYTERQPSGNQMVTQVKISKVKLSKVSNTSQEDLKKQFWDNPLFKRYQQVYPNRNYELCFEEMCQWYLVNKKRLPLVITAFGKWLSNTKPQIETPRTISSAEETKQKLKELMR